MIEELIYGYRKMFETPLVGIVNEEGIINYGKYVINKKGNCVVTILLNGERKLTKTKKGDKFDAYTGLAIAFMKYNLGITHTKFEKYVKGLEPLVKVKDGAYEQMAREFFFEITKISPKDLESYMEKHGKNGMTSLEVAVGF